MARGPSRPEPVMTARVMLEGIQERGQLRFLLFTEVHLEALVVEAHHLTDVARWPPSGARGRRRRRPERPASDRSTDRPFQHTSRAYLRFLRPPASFLIAQRRSSALGLFSYSSGASSS